MTLSSSINDSDVIQAFSYCIDGSAVQLVVKNEISRLQYKNLNRSFTYLKLFYLFENSFNNFYMLREHRIFYFTNFPLLYKTNMLILFIYFFEARATVLYPYYDKNLTNVVQQDNLTFKYTNDSTNVYFGVIYNPLQWFAIGVYSNNVSNKIAADLWVFQINGTTPYVLDYNFPNGTTGSIWQQDANQNVIITAATVTQTNASINFQRPLYDLDSEDEQFNTSLAYNYFYVTSSGNLTNTTAPIYNFSNNITLFPVIIETAYMNILEIFIIYILL